MVITPFLTDLFCLAAEMFHLLLHKIRQLQVCVRGVVVLNAKNLVLFAVVILGYEIEL